MEKKKDQGEITLEAMPVEDMRKFTLELSSHLKYNGEDYDKLTFDFHALTGADALNIEEEMQSTGRMVLVPSLSGEFMIRMAAKASVEKVGEDDLRRLSIADFLRLRSRVRTFLISRE